MTLETYKLVVTYVMAGIIGLCVGSFLNVLIYRLPNRINIAWPASHCPQCKHTIRWYDNVPVLSYVHLRAKCRYCGCHIPIRYTLVELGNMLLWLLCVPCFYEEGFLLLIIRMLFLSALTVIFFIDLEYKLISDVMQICVLLCGIGKFFAVGGYPWKDALFGMLIGGGFFLAVYLLSFVVFKREGLGFGDVKLMAGLGLFLGVRSICFTVLIASVAASVVLAVVSHAKKNPKGYEYPLAPFLTAAAALAMFVGDRLVNGYLALIFNL